MFVGFAVLGVVATILVAYRGANIGADIAEIKRGQTAEGKKLTEMQQQWEDKFSSQASTSIGSPVSTKKLPHMQNGFQSGDGFLQIAEITPHDPLLAANAPIAFNVYARNASQQPVKEASAVYSLAIIDLQRKPPQWTDKKVVANFDETVVKPWKSELKAKGMKGTEIGVGKATWGTLSFGPIDQDYVDAIETGKVKLYVLGYAQWKTMTGHRLDTSECAILQPPGHDTATRDLVWNRCEI